MGRLRLFWICTALFLLPALHPILRPFLGPPSHLLWWVHVLPVALIAYRLGFRAGLLGVAGSVALAAGGEALFGAGYGVPADDTTIWAIAISLGATDLLVMGFARWVRREETERRRSDLELRALFQESPVGIAISTEGTVRRVNPAFLDMFRAGAPEEVLGRPIVSFLAGEERERVMEIVAARERGRPAPGTYESVTEREDGTTMPVYIQATQVELGDKSLNIAFLTDLSEQKFLEAKLRQAQKLEAVGQLAGGVAHDFNNLLTVIQGHTELALARPGIEDSIREDLEAVLEGSEQAAALTQRLLAFSRKQILQPKVLDPNEAVRKTTGMLRRIIGEDVGIETDLDSDLPNVRIDPGQLDQILMNLAVNARDALPDGGTLRISTSTLAGPKEPTGELETSGPLVCLEVSDDGIGMSREVREKIFEPFFTTKDPSHGTGLGLATVYGIVKQSGGDIRVDSEVGRGTRFRILFPTADEERDVAAPERAPLLGGPESVLLVEDDEAVRRLTREMLESLGYRVVPAAEGSAALDAMERHEPFDLLLTDVALPGMNGRELARRIRERSDSTVVLYMSGHAEELAADERELEPGLSLLQKPFTRNELARAVRTTLGEDPADRKPADGRMVTAAKD